MKFQIRRRCTVLALLTVTLSSPPTLAQSAPASLPAASAREQRLIAMLTDVELSGTFRMTGDLAAHKPLGDAVPEKYTIVGVSKDEGDWWIVMARIQYMNADVQVPLRVRIVWAEDTPVITVDDLAVPGIGVYSARVMLYRDFYCGTWFGTNYGGVMSGEIRKRPAAQASQPAGG